MANSRYNVLARSFIDVTDIGNSDRLKMLVVGAGRGYEVLSLKEYFSDIIAIDNDLDSVTTDAKPLVREGDATDLAFDDESFDLIYCYHVLEHIPDYEKALLEMKRVLKGSGLIYIGVPNKSRLVGYVTVDGCSNKQKILENLRDYSARIRGRFENRFGAHAGFTAAELSAILRSHFPICEDVTCKYYLSRHGDRRAIEVLVKIPFLRRIAFPSVYFICKH